MSLMTDLIHEISPAQARKVLLWLVFECPEGGNPSYCPMHALRLQSFEARRRSITRLSDQECCSLYQTHIQCLSKEHATIADE